MKLRYCLFIVVLIYSCSQSADIELESFNLPDEPTQELREVFRTSEPIDGEFFLFINNIQILSDGNLIIHDMRHAQLYELTPEGDLVNVIGREGRGPGEFSQIRNIYVTVNDSLHVFDPLNARHQVFVKNEENEWKYSRERPFLFESQTELKSPLPEDLFIVSDSVITGLYRILPAYIRSSVPEVDTLRNYYSYVASVMSTMI